MAGPKLDVGKFKSLTLCLCFYDSDQKKPSGNARCLNSLCLSIPMTASDSFQCGGGASLLQSTARSPVASEVVYDMRMTYDVTPLARSARSALYIDLFYVWLECRGSHVWLARNSRVTFTST